MYQGTIKQLRNSMRSRMTVLTLASCLFACSMTSDAQSQDHTICLGLNCNPAGPEMDINELMEGVIAYDDYLARQNWRAYSGMDWDDRRKQCMDRCQEEYLIWKGLCFEVHGSPSMEEDPSIADGREACLQEGRRRRSQCLTPSRLMAC